MQQQQVCLQSNHARLKQMLTATGQMFATALITDPLIGTRWLINMACKKSCLGTWPAVLYLVVWTSGLG
jgi:hypothetical protein